MHAMNISWRGPGVPMGAETSPRDVFARMFGDAKEDLKRKSILDVVADDARQLKSKLGQGDHRRLDEYLESVRSLERQIAAFEQARPSGRRRRSPGRSSAAESARTRQADAGPARRGPANGLHARPHLCPGRRKRRHQGTTYERTLADFGIDKTQFAGRVDAKYLDWGHHKCSHDPKPTLPLIQAMDRWYVDQFCTCCKSSSRFARAREPCWITASWSTVAPIAGHRQRLAGPQPQGRGLYPGRPGRRTAAEDGPADSLSGGHVAGQPVADAGADGRDRAERIRPQHRHLVGSGLRKTSHDNVPLLIHRFVTGTAWPR